MTTADALFVFAAVKLRHDLDALRPHPVVEAPPEQKPADEEKVGEEVRSPCCNAALLQKRHG